MFNNLIFLQNNKLEVEELYYFITSKYEKYEGNIVPNEPILVTQSNYNGKNFDLLIMIPIKDSSDEYDAIFVQIGLNKKSSDIKALVKDILKNDTKYKNGFGQAF